MLGIVIEVFVEDVNLRSNEAIRRKWRIVGWEEGRGE
jgi:hypothetical protein